VAGALLAAPPIGASTQELYTKVCASCHGKDGRGQTPAGRKAGAKDLTVSKTSAEEVDRQIREGKQDPKKKSNMPAFAGKLSDEEIKALASYILGFRK
jgi:cytochrome c6